MNPYFTDGETEAQKEDTPRKLQSQESYLSPLNTILAGGMNVMRKYTKMVGHRSQIIKCPVWLMKHRIFQGYNKKLTQKSRSGKAWGRPESQNKDFGFYFIANRWGDVQIKMAVVVRIDDNIVREYVQRQESKEVGGRSLKWLFAFYFCKIK